MILARASPLRLAGVRGRPAPVTPRAFSSSARDDAAHAAACQRRRQIPLRRPAGCSRYASIALFLSLDALKRRRRSSLGCSLEVDKGWEMPGVAAAACDDDDDERTKKRNTSRFPSSHLLNYPKHSRPPLLLSDLSSSSSSSTRTRATLDGGGGSSDRESENKEEEDEEQEEFTPEPDAAAFANLVVCAACVAALGALTGVDPWATLFPASASASSQALAYGLAASPLYVAFLLSARSLVCEGSVWWAEVEGQGSLSKLPWYRALAWAYAVALADGAAMRGLVLPWLSRLVTSPGGVDIAEIARKAAEAPDEVLLKSTADAAAAGCSPLPPTRSSPPVLGAQSCPSPCPPRGFSRFWPWREARRPRRSRASSRRRGCARGSAPGPNRSSTRSPGSSCSTRRRGSRGWSWWSGPGSTCTGTTRRARTRPRR